MLIVSAPLSAHLGLRRRRKRSTRRQRTATMFHRWHQVTGVGELADEYGRIGAQEGMTQRQTTEWAKHDLWEKGYRMGHIDGQRLHLTFFIERLYATWKHTRASSGLERRKW